MAACLPATSPDAPKPALDRPTGRPRTLDFSSRMRPVELKSVIARPLDPGNPEHAALAGAQFLKTASDPVMIEVQTEEPMADLQPRTSWPVIELNGEYVENTRVDGKSGASLRGFLPDRRKIRSVNTVGVVWVGNETATRTRKPLTFRREDIK